MSHVMLTDLIYALWETIYMVLVSGAVSFLFGIPLGVILLATRPNGLLANKLTNTCVGSIVNAVRSIPFIILLVAVVPFTRLITGTSIGTTAAIVPLTIAAIPFVGRIVENALAEVASGLIEAGQAMGASPLQIIVKILIPEAMPGIVNGLTVTLISLIGYSAMAGAVGGGGLGDLAIRYGYQRFDVAVMVYTIIVLIFLVQALQYLGDKIARKASHQNPVQR